MSWSMPWSFVSSFVVLACSMVLYNWRLNKQEVGMQAGILVRVLGKVRSCLSLTGLVWGYTSLSVLVFYTASGFGVTLVSAVLPGSMVMFNMLLLGFLMALVEDRLVKVSPSIA